MRVVVAPDSFGGTLSAPEVAAAIRAGWLAAAARDEVVALPLSDGGPGFLDALAAALDGDLVPVTVCDPLGRPVPGAVLLVDGTAYLECAQAVGLHLVTEMERDPGHATSYGVGQLMLAAAELGAREIVVGLGGSATTDAGAGLLAAIGFDLVDVGGASLAYGGVPLIALDAIVGGSQLRGARLVAASDVDNPLTGAHGAAAVFGPQKGADADLVGRLDAALARWAEVAVRDLPEAPTDLADLPGAGAAGGLGAALLALGGARRSGIDLVCRAVGLAAALDGADLVVTGEGSFDVQSLRGKVPAGVAASAAERGVPCIVLAGQVSVGHREMAAAGIEAAYSVAEHAGSVRAALAQPDRQLRSLAARVAQQWSRR